ncbi:NUDIX hydrolase N-terminal domain-containing protein, partial [Acinetobacter baumannii]
MANPLDGLHDADHAKAEKTEGRMPSVSDPRALARLLELILSTAQAGLAFSKDRFDIGRFRALQHAVAEFIASDQGVAY